MLGPEDACFVREMLGFCDGAMIVATEGLREGASVGISGGEAEELEVVAWLGAMEFHDKRLGDLEQDGEMLAEGAITC
jgi:hypothetical protein